MDAKPVYKRVMLKLSGEALMGDDPYGINRATMERIVAEVTEVVRMGVEVGVVIGGGNIFRGVAPGDYRLFAWESTPPNAYQNANFIRKYESRAKLVHVGQGGSVTAQLTVIPAIETR